MTSLDSRQLSVLLVDDDAIVRSWVQGALEESGLRLAAVAQTAAEARAFATRRAADVLLVDYRLPDAVGTELLRDLRRQGVAAPALLMTANPERGFNELAREAGAQGSILKTGESERLLASLRTVAGGGQAFDGRHPPRPRGEAALSPREREVLRLVAAGRTNREIATELAVGAETVKTLVARTFSKLGTRRRAEAVAAATKLGAL